jgi:hypothetical protein
MSDTSADNRSIVYCWGAVMVASVVIILLLSVGLHLVLRRISIDFMTVHLNLPYAEMITGNRVVVSAGVERGIGLGLLAGSWLGMCCIAGTPKLVRFHVFARISLKWGAVSVFLLLLASLVGLYIWKVAGLEKVQPLLGMMLSIEQFERVHHQTSQPYRGLFCFLLYYAVLWGTGLYFLLVGVSIFRHRFKGSK